MIEITYVNLETVSHEFNIFYLIVEHTV